MPAESKRIKEIESRSRHWRRWGPYLSERQWGTVREDYSPNGNAWDDFPHHHAFMRAYRWGEDGLAGISDNHQRLCFALAFWNEEDPILKERLFGLTWSEGNHGESVKEYYYYLDNVPSHSFMKHLYRYPHCAFPYELLTKRSRELSRKDSELELIELGVFDQGRYFDIFTEYAKASPNDIYIRITAHNRAAEAKALHILPTLWFRNTWSWHKTASKPLLKQEGQLILARQQELGEYRLEIIDSRQALLTETLFCENNSNTKRLFGADNESPYTKDSFHRYLIDRDRKAVNPALEGSKACVHCHYNIPAKSEVSLILRLSAEGEAAPLTTKAANALFQQRQEEADEFYNNLAPAKLRTDLKTTQRQAFAGLLWTKQFYHYVVEDWLNGDETSAPPPPERRTGRNAAWVHVYNDDILSMPDKWEYPWFASWDTAFHLIPLSMIDPDFAKRQLILLTREWYMHPNGQIPAYEWDFNDVTPPVQAWAAYRVYKIEKRMTGQGDRQFLERVFQKLLLNFTWWVNRKDPNGQNVFQGGFLGLDNIGVFDRSKEIPAGGQMKQSDSTSWMAMYCLNMLVIAIELSKANLAYEDIASKFFEHFLYIAHAMNHRSKHVPGLWDEEDGFYYDVLHLPGKGVEFLKVRSLVGLIPLFAVLTLEPEIISLMPGFKSRMKWFIENRPDLQQDVAKLNKPGAGDRLLLALVNKERLKRILQRMLDPEEFLSPYGIRSVSKYHKDNPYILKAGGDEYRVDYEPAESSSSIYGGNSNWRGPIWWPINFLIIEAIQRFSHYYGDSLKIECPTGSGNFLPLWDIGTELSLRLLKLFARDENSNCPADTLRHRPEAPEFFKTHPLFYEYFHADNGKGLGASHQTGWTALVAKLIQQSGELLK